MTEILQQFYTGIFPTQWNQFAAVIVLVWLAASLSGYGKFGKKKKGGTYHNSAQRYPIDKVKTLQPAGAEFAATTFQQMDSIEGIEFETVPILNEEEARLLPVLEGATKEFGDGHRLMAHSSLGEVLRPNTSGPMTDIQAAHASILSRRLDFAIFDQRGHLAAAIEYQGSAHDYSSAFDYDAIKQEALRKAGIPCLEIRYNYSDKSVREQVAGILQRKN